MQFFSLVLSTKFEDSLEERKWKIAAYFDFILPSVKNLRIVFYNRNKACYLFLLRY